MMSKVAGTNGVGYKILYIDSNASVKYMGLGSNNGGMNGIRNLSYQPQPQPPPHQNNVGATPTLKIVFPKF